MAPTMSLQALVNVSSQNIDQSIGMRETAFLIQTWKKD
jgi:hypothetical protein